MGSKYLIFTNFYVTLKINENRTKQYENMLQNDQKDGISMFHIIPENFFVPLASPNKIVYWECICKLFSIMEHQLSFGVERDVLVEELQYYFESANSAELIDEEV